MTNKTTAVYWKLFFISLASLFLEILIIRWISTEVRIFAYFKNLSLIACFLGLGLGYATAERYKSMKGTLVTILLLVLLMRTPFVPEDKLVFHRITHMLSFDDFFVWATMRDLPQLGQVIIGLVLMIILFAMIVALFVPMGQYLGRLFERSPNRIHAYSINVVGSLLGIWLFSLLSYLSYPPHYWFVVGLLLLIPGLLDHKKQIVLVVVVAVVSGVLVRGISKPEADVFGVSDTLQAVSKPESKTTWSPYQKLVYRNYTMTTDPQKEPYTFSIIEVNNTLYQYLFDFSKANIQMHPSLFPSDPRVLSYDYYNIPYKFHPNPKDILIVGAGAGNDVAGALRNTSAVIDAVEIDPKIFALGKAHHAEKPYQANRVNGIVNDARSFLKKTDKKYDMILYGLLDSHTLSSNFSNVSLDNYVYTYESFLEAKNHLKPGGVIVLSFQVNKDWIGQRIAKGLHMAFGYWPITFRCYGPFFYRGTGGKIFVTGAYETIGASLGADPVLRQYIRDNTIDYQSEIRPVTDDWPYLWLKTASIPKLHLLVTISLALISCIGARAVFGRKRTVDWQYFFLGAAFLLMEVHIISKLMLLFGSTWIVNSFVISGILIMILGANAYVNRMKINSLSPYYLALFCSLILTYLFPLDSLFFTNYLVRGVLAGLLFTFPLFFAGVIFAENIRRCADIKIAFGSNLLGAVLGGLAEVLSFIVGIRMLTCLALCLYLLAFLALQKMNRSTKRAAS